MSATLRVTISTDPEVYGLEADETEEAERCANAIAKAAREQFENVDTALKFMDIPVRVSPSYNSVNAVSEARAVFNWIDARWSELSGREL